MSTSTIRTALNLVLPLLQPLAGAMAPLFGIGITMAEMSAASETPVTPARYAFIIWSLLFALSIAWGIWQALPAGRDSVPARRLGWPMAGVFAFSILWMVLSALTGNGWHLVVVMLLTLACALTAFFIARNEPSVGWPDRWLIRPLTGMLAGWVTAATFANIAGAARVSGIISSTGAAGTFAAILILLAAAGLALGVLWVTKGAIWYAIAFGWAVAAILYANTVERAFNPGVAAVSAGLLALVAAISWQRARIRRPATV